MTAREAADRLATIADESGIDRLKACPALADGRVLAAEGDAGAVARMTRAVELFGSLGLPFESGRAQLELSRVLAASRPAVAAREGKLAVAAFDRLARRSTRTQPRHCCAASVPQRVAHGRAELPH